MQIETKRIYEQGSSDDGLRILVDRIWPRGVSKEEANLDYWAKEIAPSPELRKWFGHDPDKYEAFAEKYKEELKSGKQLEELEHVKTMIRSNGKATLLYGAKDEMHNQAKVLKAVLEEI